MKLNIGRPSASLVLGTMAGALAAIAFLPTSIPLIWQIIRAEERLGLRHTEAAAYAIHAQLLNAVEPTESMRIESAVDFLYVERPGRPPTVGGTALPHELVDEACAAGVQDSCPATRQKLLSG